MKIRCLNCGYQIGESAVPLIFVGLAKDSRDAETHAPEPRDVRKCYNCRHWNTFVPDVLDGVASNT